MLFILPMALSITLTGFFMFSDEGPFWKGFILVIEVLSLFFQFTPHINVHFIIPFLMQIAITISLAIYYIYQSNR